MSQVLFLCLIVCFAFEISNEQICSGGKQTVCPYPLDGVAVNVAVNKPAEQSTTYKYGGSASLAVDGDTDQHFWHNKSCSHTAEHFVTHETVPWLRVDLGKPHLVKKVRIHTRNDPCCADRYHDMQIRVGNEKEEGLGIVFAKNGLCNELVGGGKEQGEILHFDCRQCLVGRYVTVQIVRNCVDCNLPCYNILSVCELQVMGYQI